MITDNNDYKNVGWGKNKILEIIFKKLMSKGVEYLIHL